MSNWDDYKREERQKVEPGDYRVMITEAEETTSKAGNPMIKLNIVPNTQDGTKINIKHYIVKNEYFNRNMTEIFDSFNIPEGNFNFLEWVNAVGAARLKEDEDGYLKIHYFLNKKKAEKLPEWYGEKPERNMVSEEFSKVVDDDDMPWG